MGSVRRNFLVSLGPASVRVRTSLDLAAAHRQLGADGLSPLYGIREIGPAASAADRARWLRTRSTLIHVDGRPPDIRSTLGRDSDVVRVQCPLSALGDGAPLLTVVTILVERRLQLAGYMSLLGACVALPHGAVLLLGPPGSGKTSTVLALCRAQGGRLVANDVLVAGIPHMMGRTTEGRRGEEHGPPTALTGSTTVFVRPVAIARHHPELLAHLPVPARGGTGRKVPFLPHELGLTVTPGPVELVGAYLVHVDDRLRAAEVTAPPANTRHGLYENVSRYVRATAEPFLADAGRRFLAFLPGMDSPTCHEARVAFVERIVGDLQLRAVSGTAADVAAAVAAGAAARPGA